jgi:hypothetical protein
MMSIVFDPPAFASIASARRWSAPSIIVASYGSPNRHPWARGAGDPECPFSVVPTISFLATLSRRWSLPLGRAASGFPFSDNISGGFASVGISGGFASIGFMFKGTVGCDDAPSPWLSTGGA